MKREFNKGDIAHISNPRRVAGVINPASDDDSHGNLRRFTLEHEQAIEIASYQKADEKTCCGWTYNGWVEHKGVRYYVECIGQNKLISKNMWAEMVRLKTEIARLKAELAGKEVPHA